MSKSNKVGYTKEIDEEKWDRIFGKKKVKEEIECLNCHRMINVKYMFDGFCEYCRNLFIYD
jgi:hypothetical protein